MLRKTHLYLIVLFCIWPLTAQERIINGLKITGSEHWSGTIIVKGDVVVGRDARLVIEAGTKIIFDPHRDSRRSGRDKTSSEIIVEGLLIARGHLNNNIVFSSNSNEPRMGDWFGISITNPEQISIFEYVTVEYAYNGLSIKKSNPIISNSQIRFNYNSGIIAEVKAEAKIISNIISENGYAGLICKLGAKPYLSNNLITLNQIGVVTFSMSQPNMGTLRSGEDYNIGENRLFDNHEYNFYNHSAKDIMAENNYWGTEETAQLMAKIYDASSDGKYGTVKFIPVLGSEQDMQNLMALSQTSVEENTYNAPSAQQTAAGEITNPVQNDSIPEDTSTFKGKELMVVNLPHRTLDDIMGNFEDDNAAASTVQEERSTPDIDYKRVFLDAFLDKRKEVVRSVAPVIQNKERGLDAHGKVIIQVIVSKDGKIESSKILRGLNYYYDDISLEAAGQFVFMPGTIDGRPVRFSTNLFFEF